MRGSNAGETVVANRLPGDLPQTARADRRACGKAGIRSAIALPFKVGPEICGWLSLGSLSAERPWPDDFVAVLHYLGEILASAIERKQAWTKIGELRQFERLLSEISARYINLSVDQIEEVMRSDLGRLGRLLGVDRCSLDFIDNVTSGWAEIARPEWFRKFAWWPEEDTETVAQFQEWLSALPEDHDYGDQAQLERLEKNEVWKFSGPR